MTTQQVVDQHRTWVWVFRIGFFALGALILVLWFTNDFLGGLALIQVSALIIQSLLVGTAVRNPVGWSLLAFSAIGVALIFLASFGIMFPFAPDPNSLLGGIAFTISFFGFIFFYTSLFATLVVALCVLADDWRDRHGGTTAPPPTTSH
jgi:hypothetical protein